uniref:Uncharacterized protein n=1 Tax=Anguilla anguilla TaxID=7936 RepID=A0A0E9RVK8_ANGAN
MHRHLLQTHKKK